MNNEILNLDHEWLFSIQQNRFPILDGTFNIISHIATYVVIILILHVGLQAFLKKSKILFRKFYSLAFIEIISAVTISILKNYFQRERPYVTFLDIEKIGSGGGLSFPSGHTTEAFCMAWAFVLILPEKPAYKLLFIWAALVAYSRMLLGVHYPLDILGGVFFGSMVALLYYRFIYLKNK